LTTPSDVALDAVSWPRNAPRPFLNARAAETLTAVDE
jgi:hypothetical protein